MENNHLYNGCVSGLLERVDLRMPAIQTEEHFGDSPGLAILTLRDGDERVLKIPFFGKIGQRELAILKGRRVFFEQRVYGFLNRRLDQYFGTREVFDFPSVIKGLPLSGAYRLIRKFRLRENGYSVF